MRKQKVCISGLKSPSRKTGQATAKTPASTTTGRPQAASATPAKNGSASGKTGSSQAPGFCAVGEIGLGGEVRHVSGIEQRIREAVRLGFTQILCPPVAMKAPPGCELLPVRRLDDALQMLA